MARKITCPVCHQTWNPDKVYAAVLPGVRDLRLHKHPDPRVSGRPECEGSGRTVPIKWR